MKFIFVLVWKTSEPIKYEEQTALRKGGIFREYPLVGDSIGQSCLDLISQIMSWNINL